MTDKDKAKELVDKYLMQGFGIGINGSKECAIICVDEILEQLLDCWSRIPNIGSLIDYIPYQYWQDVKSEIEKL